MDCFYLLKMTSEQARNFIKEVSKHPTHPTKEWVVKDIRTVLAYITMCEG